MTEQHQQEMLSMAYIHAVAARCGMTVSKPILDYGIDLVVNELTRRENRICESGWRLDIQAKSTAVARIDDNAVKCDLPVENYNDLREPCVPTQRILVLLVLPASECEWTAQNEDGLLLRRCAYWTSLKNQPATNNKTTKRISIGRGNVFTPDALVKIMECIRRGDEL